MKTKNDLFKDLFSDLIRLIILYVVLRIYWGHDQWYQDQIKEIWFGIITASSFLVLTFIKQPFARPVRVTSNLRNSRYEGNETRVSIHGKRRTPDYERTVELELSVSRRYSVYGLLVLWMLQKYNLTLLVEPVPFGLILQAEEEQMRQDLRSTSRGFEILLGDYLFQILSNSSSGQFQKRCTFLVSDDRNHYVTRETFQIRPKLRSNSINVPWWMSFLLDFQYDEHTVKFTRG